MIELNPNIQRALNSSKPILITYLIGFTFGSEKYYLTDNPGDINHANRVYRGDGNISEVKLPKQGENLTREIATITLNEVPEYPKWSELIKKNPLSSSVEISIFMQEDENDPGQNLPVYKGKSIRNFASAGQVEIRFGGPFSQIDGEYAYVTSKSNQETRDLTDTAFDDVGQTFETEWGGETRNNLRFTHSLNTNHTTYFQVAQFELSYDLSNVVTGGKGPYVYNPGQVITKTYVNTKHNIGPSVIIDTIPVTVTDADNTVISGTLRVRVEFSGQPYHGLLGETPFGINKIGRIDNTYYANRAGQDLLYTIDPTNPNNTRLLGPPNVAGDILSITEDRGFNQDALLILTTAVRAYRVNPSNFNDVRTPWGVVLGPAIRDENTGSFIVTIQRIQYVGNILYGIVWTTIESRLPALYTFDTSNNTGAKVGDLPNIFRNTIDLAELNGSLYAAISGQRNLYKVDLTNPAASKADNQLPLPMITGLSSFQNGLLISQTENNINRLWSTEVQ